MCAQLHVETMGRVTADRILDSQLIAACYNVCFSTQTTCMSVMQAGTLTWTKMEWLKNGPTQ